MLSRVWKPITATLVIGGPAYYFYYRERDTFVLPIKTRGTDGKLEMSTRRISLLPLKEVDARIQENAVSETHNRPNGISWKRTTAFLASNDPIEDAHSNQIIERDASDSSAPGDYLFFTVMDGHSGYQTSRLLSRILIKAVALELSALTAESNPRPQLGLYGRLQSLLGSTRPQSLTCPLDADPHRVSLAIQDAFTKLDTELIQAPIRILANNLDEESRNMKKVPDLSKHPLALTSMLPALSGSCALMAVFDTAHRNLYVACTGDSRAVAGVWESSADGKGQWRVEVLTEDQTGRNPSERARMILEHPKGEAEDVIREGRVLGGLEPSRAFGDARYKWPLEMQIALSNAFMRGNNKPLRYPPSVFKTPPYVTALPVVTHRDMSLTASDGSPPSQKAIRFLVLATDGLWDALSNDEVVSLVGGHLTGLKGTIPKSQLPSLVPTISGSQGIEGKDKTAQQKTGSWAFTDDNLSAHLIRNAFGGGDEMALRRILSIPAPYSRKYRDDVTVTVVCWEDGNEQQAQIFSEKLKSKL